MARRGRLPGTQQERQAKKGLVPEDGGFGQIKGSKKGKESDRGQDVKQPASAERHGWLGWLRNNGADKAGVGTGTESNMELATKDEEQLVKKALERIQQAHASGKKNICLSKREYEALERKRRHESDSQGPRRSTEMRTAKRSRAAVKDVSGNALKRQSEPSLLGRQVTASHLQFGAQGKTGASVDRPSHADLQPSSSSGGRALPSSAYLDIPQKSSLPSWPQYPPEQSVYPDQSFSSPYQAFPYPVADGPHWGYGKMDFTSYLAAQPMYPSYNPADVSYTLWNQNMMSSAMVPYDPSRVASPGEHYPSSSVPYSLFNQHAPPGYLTAGLLGHEGKGKKADGGEATAGGSASQGSRQRKRRRK